MILTCACGACDACGGGWQRQRQGTAYATAAPGRAAPWSTDDLKQRMGQVGEYDGRQNLDLWCSGEPAHPPIIATSVFNHKAELVERAARNLASGSDAEIAASREPCAGCRERGRTEAWRTWQ